MSILEDFIALFYPRCCFACCEPLMKGEELLCSGCLVQLPKTSYHRWAENPVMSRLAGRLPLRSAFAFLKFMKGGVVQRLLHELKYNNRPEIGVRIGNLYAHELVDAGYQDSFDLIVPVPLHSSRLRKRGYNQSAKFAEGLAEVLRVPWEESIAVRRQSTSTQTRKGRAARWDNVSSAFSSPSSHRIKGQRILLVDDVITTGATLEACGQHLVEHQCSALSIACIAEA
jgi:ComF family protein